MSLSQDAFSFLNAPHLPVVGGRFDLPITVGQFFGVRGESHIIGEPYGRDLSCEITLQNYATIALLEAALHHYAIRAGRLTGTLTETLGGFSRQFPKCTFLGFEPGSEPFVDGSGVHGWVMFGRLLWRQRQRA